MPSFDELRKAGYDSDKLIKLKELQSALQYLEWQRKLKNDDLELSKPILARLREKYDNLKSFLDTTEAMRNEQC